MAGAHHHRLVYSTIAGEGSWWESRIRGVRVAARRAAGGRVVAAAVRRGAAVGPAGGGASARSACGMIPTRRSPERKREAPGSKGLGDEAAAAGLAPPGPPALRQR